MREVHFERQLSFQYFQISVKPCLNVSGKQIFHSGELTFYVIFVKSIVISQTVGKLDVNRWIAGFHQFEVHQKTSGSAVAVNKGVDALNGVGLLF